MTDTRRATAEWKGSSPDAKIPDRVRLRVFERFGGVCQISGLKIRGGDAWDVDHRTPLRDGGEHRESNLQPVLRAEHRKKTAAEAKERARCERIRKKHLGLHKPRSPLPGGKNSRWKKRLDGTVVER